MNFDEICESEIFLQDKEWINSQLNTDKKDLKFLEEYKLLFESEIDTIKMRYKKDLKFLEKYILSLENPYPRMRIKNFSNEDLYKLIKKNCRPEYFSSRVILYQIALLIKAKENKWEDVRLLGDCIFGKEIDFRELFSKIKIGNRVITCYYYWMYSRLELDQNFEQKYNDFYIIGREYLERQDHTSAQHCFIMGSYSELLEYSEIEINDFYENKNENDHPLYKEISDILNSDNLKIPKNLFELAKSIEKDHSDCLYDGNWYWMIFYYLIRKDKNLLIWFLFQISHRIRFEEMAPFVKILTIGGVKKIQDIHDILLYPFFDSIEEIIIQDYMENFQNRIKYESENKILRDRLVNQVQQFSHALSNTIFPQTIYSVVKRLKDKPELRKEVILLNDAYQAEREIQLQGALLQRRSHQQDPESFRTLIRQDRLTTIDSEPGVGIEEILNYTASRVLARFLNANYSKLRQVREQFSQRLQLGLEDLREDFEEQILFEESQSALEWMSSKLGCRVHIHWKDERWRKVRLKKERYAETVLYGHFAEIIFNALKYGDDRAEPFLQIILFHKLAEPVSFLGIRFENSISREDRTGMGTGNGLESIAEDLRQLNGSVRPEDTLLRSKEGQNFSVTLCYHEDLLLLREQKRFSMPSD